MASGEKQATAEYRISKRYEEQTLQYMSRFYSRGQKGRIVNNKSYKDRKSTRLNSSHL